MLDASEAGPSGPAFLWLAELRRLRVSDGEHQTEPCADCRTDSNAVGDVSKGDADEKPDSGPEGNQNQQVSPA